VLLFAGAALVVLLHSTMVQTPNNSQNDNANQTTANQHIVLRFGVGDMDTVRLGLLGIRQHAGIGFEICDNRPLRRLHQDPCRPSLGLSRVQRSQYGATDEKVLHELWITASWRPH